MEPEKSFTGAKLAPKRMLFCNVDVFLSTFHVDKTFGFRFLVGINFNKSQKGKQCLPFFGIFLLGEKEHGERKQSRVAKPSRSDAKRP